MNDCEVCLEPDPSIRVTYESDTADPVTFAVCPECATLMFMAMAQRYNSAVAEANDAVNEICRWLGIEVPT